MLNNKNLIVLIIIISLSSIAIHSQILRVNPEISFQEIEGFGDCSMYGHLTSTYGYFHKNSPEKLDEIADMLFTSNNPDTSWAFKFFHQVGNWYLIDENTKEYIPKSVIDMSERLWYRKKLVDRGGRVGLREPSVFIR